MHTNYALGFLGGGEIMWIVILALLLFGGSQIPKLAKSIGRAKKDFQDGMAEGEADDDTPKIDDKKDKDEDKS